MTADTLARPPPASRWQTHCHNCGAHIAEPPPPQDDADFDDALHLITGHHATDAEWSLLMLLRRRPNQLVRYGQIIQSLYGETREEPECAEASVKVFLHHLRRKLQGSHWHVETVGGQGLVGRRHD